MLSGETGNFPESLNEKDPRKTQGRHVRYNAHDPCLDQRMEKGVMHVRAEQQPVGVKPMAQYWRLFE